MMTWKLITLYHHSWHVGRLACRSSITCHNMSLSSIYLSLMCHRGLLYIHIQYMLKYYAVYDTLYLMNIPITKHIYIYTYIYACMRNKQMNEYYVIWIHITHTHTYIIIKPDFRWVFRIDYEATNVLLLRKLCTQY